MFSMPTCYDKQCLHALRQMCLSGDLDKGTQKNNAYEAFQHEIALTTMKNYLKTYDQDDIEKA